MISRAAYEKLNDAALIEKRDMWFARLSNLFDGKQDEFNMHHAFALDGFVPCPEDYHMTYTDPEEWIAQCMELCAALPPFDGNRFAPVCVEYPLYGVHFVDRVLGAEVFEQENNSNVYWNACLKTPIGSLQMPDMENNETWDLAKRAAKAFVEADVRLPLYGMPILSSPLNILLNLYGEEALIAMIEEEEAVMHDMRIITDVIGAMHKWHRANVPAAQLQPCLSWNRTQPSGFGQICGCSTQLLSGAMYRKFIAPLDDELLAIYPHGGMIHLCGAHTQHLDCFRDMPHLRAVQINHRAAEDLQEYLSKLRKDQIVYINTCPGMTVEDTLRISGGKRIVVADPIDAPMLD